MRYKIKLYIAILDEFPDFMVPTLVAHTVLNADKVFSGDRVYDNWFKNSFKKVTLRVSQKEFDKIVALGAVHVGHERNTLGGRSACAVVRPYVFEEDVPNVLRWAKLWRPKNE